MNKSSGSMSVHLEKFPNVDEIPYDKTLLNQIEAVRSICNAALSIRSTHDIKVKIPLQKLVVYCAEEMNIEHLQSLIKDEVNVREIEFSRNVEELGRGRAVLNLKSCGAKFGPRTGHLMSLVNAGNWTLLDDNRLQVDDQILEEEDFAINFDTLEKEGSTIKYARLTFNVFSKLKYHAFVALDISITPELERFGMVREIVRCIQQSRKALGISMGNIVWLNLKGDSEKLSGILSDPKMTSYICSNTLSVLQEESHFSNKMSRDFSYEIEDLGSIKTTLAPQQN